MKIGIMQGRLVPPVENRIQCFPRDDWQREFVAAKDAGLGAIEWIYDLYGADVNPLATDATAAEVRSLAVRHGVEVRSVCADIFMDRPLVRVGEAEREARTSELIKLLRRCGSLGMNRLVLPFVDASRIETNDDSEAVVRSLEQALLAAEQSEIEIHLETSLAPEQFARLLDRVPHARLKVNYDSGNSASLGYDAREEFAAYGERVGSVHIKDRVRGGTTVPLGQGDVDFAVLIECLKKINYAGDFVLQVARDVPGDEVAWARHNRRFFLDRWAAG